MSSTQEVSKRKIPAAKNDETKFTWHGTALTSLTDLGLTIFTFSKDFRSFSREINYEEHVVEHPKHSVTAELVPPSFVPSLKDNLNYTQLISDPVLWPHNPQLEAEATRITSYEWAPTKLIFNNEYILTTITCTGNVELLTFEQNKWLTKYNLTKKYLEIKPATENLLKTSKQLRDVMDVYASSAICWQPNMLDDYSCYFVTVQYNSDLLFWLITSDNTTISLELKSTFKLGCADIISIKWIPVSDVNFHIVCSDVTGQIFTFKFSLENNTISLVDTTLLWEDQDKMVARYVTYSIKSDNIILLYGKNRHLVVQLLNKNGNIINQSVKNINDFKIAAIVANEDSFYVGTSNCKIYTINVTNTSNLVVDITPFQLPKEISSAVYELQSVSISNDNSFLGLGLLDIKLCIRKSKVTLDVVVLNNKPPENIVFELLNNPDKELTNLWQSVEYLRHRIIKTKSMPDLDYIQLYSQAEQDIYKLKIYYLFLNWYHYLMAIFSSVPNLMPEMSLEKVREKILLLHAVSILSNIKKYPYDSEFEKEVLNGTKRCILYYCDKYKESIDKYIEVKTIENIKLNKYHCNSCDEEIKYLTCKYNHFSLFCIISFTLIEGENYLTCKHCNVVARIELFSSKPRCVFCDLLLCKS